MTTEKSFEGQTAIITGGADGLGFALAKRLVANGVTAVLFDRDDEKLARAKSLLGESCRAFAVDVTRPAEVKTAVNVANEEFGRLDILVNSAGITGTTNQNSLEVNLVDFLRVMELNVTGSLITFQAVAPLMLARRYGRVLHIASIAGKEGNVGMLAYSVSKAAVIGMAKVQGKEFAQSGITVNALAPAVIKTALVEALPEEQVTYMTEKIPMKRCGTLEEFAATAAFIVSPENSFSTGFCFDLSGGRATY